MKISIITVVYNNNLTISDAINSVLNQNYGDLEYIIIDGGSVDGTIDIIKSFGEKISIFVTEPDTGIYDAMNKGIRLASGEIIGILNSDDFYQDKNVIKDVMDRFKSDQSVDIVYGNIVYVESNDIRNVVRNWISKDYYNNFFEHGNVPPHPSLFVKKKIYQKIGLFNIKYEIAADYEFMLRSMKKEGYKSKYIDRLIVRMRLGGTSNKSLKNIYSANKEVYYSWRNNGLKIPLSFFPNKLFKRLFQYLK